jgi:hypothetical protein
MYLLPVIIEGRPQTRKRPVVLHGLHPHLAKHIHHVRVHGHDTIPPPFRPLEPHRCTVKVNARPGQIQQLGTTAADWHPGLVHWRIPT